MDVFGYSPYPYNQSEELAKQMFAEQALATALPCDTSTPEAHNMPAPTGSPWTGQSLPWSLQSPPHLVQFTAQTPESKISPIVHSKRKSLDIEPVIPTKQFITEEKMAAHLNSLHISSDYKEHLLANEDVMDISMDSTPLNISEKLKGHRIVLSEDVKKLQKEPLLPASLIESFQKPQMSLVVWKPREDIIGKIQEETNATDSEKVSMRKRNGLLVLDQTRMDMEV